jgi:hypothetical protein
VDGCCEQGNEPSIKYLEILVAAQLVASEDGFVSMEIVA